MTNDNTKSKKIEQEEIDLFIIAKTLWKNKKIIIYITFLFGVIGFFVAILSPKEFTASSTIVPQTTNPQSKIGGGLSGLAAMAGINLSMSGGSDITPKLYPEIVSSVPFRLELMNTRLQFESIAEPTSLFDYFTEYQKLSIIGIFMKYTIGLPGVIIKAIRGEKQEGEQEKSAKTLIKLTEKQSEVQKNIAKRVGIMVNDKDGYISISCSMPEPLAAAQLAQSTQELLQRYITEFKIEKAKANHDFIQQRYNEAKNNYQNTQEKLANFRDRNKNVSTAIAQTENERLTSEFALANNVYSELAKQLEQAKIQVKEETPVFTIIKPVTVPLEKSKPNRPLILLIWIFLGVISSIVMVFGGDYWGKVKVQWNDIN